MKQLTVYDAIRTVHRDVVRWQVRTALEAALRLLSVSGAPCGFTPQDKEARRLREKMMSREYKRRSDRRRRQFEAELATLKANVRAAVLEVWGPRGSHLRVVK
jgi:hypothetical protein